MSEGTHRHTVWLTDDAWAEVQKHYKEDNCSTLNEYIEKAIRLYSGYLNTEKADDYLPRVPAGMQESKPGAPGDRIGRQRCRQPRKVYRPAASPPRSVLC